MDIAIFYCNMSYKVVSPKESSPLMEWKLVDLDGSGVYYGGMGIQNELNKIWYGKKLIEKLNHLGE